MKNIKSETTNNLLELSFENLESLFDYQRKGINGVIKRLKDSPGERKKLNVSKLINENKTKQLE